MKNKIKNDAIDLITESKHRILSILDGGEELTAVRIRDAYDVRLESGVRMDTQSLYYHLYILIDNDFIKRERKLKITNKKKKTKNPVSYFSITKKGLMAKKRLDFVYEKSKND